MVIVFDLNGTLLDLHALAPHIRHIFGRKLTVDAFFTQVIQYSMALTLAGDYQEFGDIAISVLEMAATANNVKLTSSDIEMVRDAMQQLPPFADAKKALRRLQKAEQRLAVLTNSTPAALEAQLDHADLRQYFEHARSVDTIRRYKPAREVYIRAAEAFGVEPSDMVMVAAHPWDLLGASRAGCQTAYVARPGTAWMSSLPRPEYVARDLDELTDQLLAGTAYARRHGLTTAAITAVGLGLAAALAPTLIAHRPRTTAPQPGS